MFTGIIEEMGKVLSLTKQKNILLWDGSQGEGWVLVIQASIVLQGAYEGCSIAVNGTCLTVTQFTDTTFTVGCAPETMRRTNLIDLQPNDMVNLERSIEANGRNSGHFVQGHVDNTAIIENMWKEGDSLWIRIGVDNTLFKYIVPKGFIAIDGTSLTVCDVVKRDASTSTNQSIPILSSNTSTSIPNTTNPNEITSSYGYFTVMLIEYTQKHIILPHKIIGQKVNIEVDVMSKYVERSTQGLVSIMDNMNQQFTNLINKLTDRIDNIENRLKVANL